jgi:hypothetical protein
MREYVTEHGDGAERPPRGRKTPVTPEGRKVERR